VNTRKGEGVGEGCLVTGERKGEVITVDASIAACAVDMIMSLLL